LLNINHITKKIHKITLKISYLQSFIEKAKNYIDSGIEKLEYLRDSHIKKVNTKPLAIYFFPTLIVLTALIFKLILKPFIGLSEGTFLLFITAVIISSWYGGLRTGIYTTLLSAFIIDYFFIPKIYSLFDNKENFSLGLFTLIGISLSWLNDELLYIMRKSQKLSKQNQQEKDMLNIIMENTKAHLAYLDTNFNFININQSYAQECGYRKESLIGKNHFELFPNKENGKIFKMVKKTGKPVEFKEKPFVYKNQPEKGTTYWDWTLIPIKNTEKEVIGLVLSLVNVTESVISRQILKQTNKSLQIYGKIINNTADLVAVINKNYIYEIVNPTYTKMYQTSNENIIGKTITGLVGKKVFEETIKNKIDLAFKGQTVEYSSWFDFPNTGRRYMHVTYYPLEEEKKVKRIVIVIHDETEEKISREIQRSLTKKISTILESINDAFFAVDKDWNFTYINNQAEKFFKKTRAELIGRSLWQTFIKSKNSKIYQTYYKKEQHSTNFEEYYNEINRWLEIKTYSSKDGLSVYLRDITERKEAESRKDEFVSIASHELKTPLTSAKAYTEIFHRNFGNLNTEEKDFYFKRILNQLEKLKNLTDELLDISKIQLGKIELKIEEIDINSLFIQTIQDLQNILKSHKIILSGRITNKILADKYRMSQVLTNLINNAVKYSPQANKVIVNLFETSKYITVEIKDYGIGIKKEKQKMIFNKYYQIKNPDKGRFPGMGLGLYISAKIIENHGGKIWVQSTEGEGSSFYFRLPLNHKTIDNKH